MNIKVAIVDDHKLFRKSFELLLVQIPRVEVVCKCSNGLELLQALETLVIEVVFLDIQMPEMDGYQTSAILSKNYPKIKIIVLTSFSDPYSVSRMLQYPIVGYLTKNTTIKQLRRAILTVNESGVYFDKQLKEIAKDLTGILAQKKVVISERELEIIKLSAKQYNGKEVADKLDISFRTVEKHKENLMLRLETNNFIGVIMYAFLSHYINENDI